jgi:NADH-quinone oxidoreductase subunit D
VLFRSMATQHEIELIDSATRAQQAMDEELRGERMIINMGPQHPSTHGVLRLVVELDGEEITNVWPDVGYLHRGDEKLAENMTYTQFIPYTDRLDYLAPLANNVAYACAVEKLCGMDVPPRCQYIRVVCAELARISSHLLGIGAMAMDIGAMTVFLYTFREREKILDLFESLTGARMMCNYMRFGGCRCDLPPGWLDQAKQVVDQFPRFLDELQTG